LTACGKQVCLDDFFGSFFATIFRILNGFFSQADAYRALVGDNLRTNSAIEFHYRGHHSASGNLNIAPLLQDPSLRGNDIVAGGFSVSVGHLSEAQN
jgi:hypothetical protein